MRLSLRELLFHVVAWRLHSGAVAARLQWRLAASEGPDGARRRPASHMAAAARAAIPALPQRLAQARASRSDCESHEDMLTHVLSYGSYHGYTPINA